MTEHYTILVASVGTLSRDSIHRTKAGRLLIHTRIIEGAIVATGGRPEIRWGAPPYLLLGGKPIEAAPTDLPEWHAAWFIESNLDIDRVREMFEAVGKRGVAQGTGRFVVRDVSLSRRVRVDGVLVSREEWERTRNKVE